MPKDTFTPNAPPPVKKPKVYHPRKPKVKEEVKEIEVAQSAPPPVIPEVVEAPKKARAVIWEPFPGPQIDFLAADEDEVLFSGGRGSGKSDAFLADVLRYVHIPRFRALILRRTMPALKDLIRDAKSMYTRTFPGVKWREQEKMFVFPSGASIDFGYLDTIDDCERYHGQEYSWLGIDEISQFPEIDWYFRLKGSIRSTLMRTKIRACVPYGDVLTVDGWKDIKEVKAGDLVYSVLKDGTLVEKPVISSVSYDIDEDITKVNKKTLFMSMTNDHKVIYNESSNKEYKSIAWDEHKGRSIKVCRAPTDYIQIGYSGRTIGNLSVNDYLAFMGIYIAEGSISQKVYNGNYSCIITQQKKESTAKIKELLAKTGIKWCYCANGDFKATNQELWNYLKQFGKAKDKFIPREILKTANKEQLKILFDWAVLGDGHWQSKTSCTYVTTSKQLSEDIAEIAFKIGYRVQIGTIPTNNINHNTRYNVYINTSAKTSCIDKNKDNVFKERFKGKVYCISVEDTNNFVIKQNNFIWLSNNTTNPTGVGRAWVKEYWIDQGAPNTRIVEKIDSPFGILELTKRWIHSSIKDNPALMASPQYLAILSSMQEPLRSAWLNGDWDAVEGMAFPEFKKSIHVIPPFHIGHNWLKFRGIDWGYASPAVCIWCAVDYDNNLYVYREFATNGSISKQKYEDPLTAELVARKVLELEAGENVKYGVMDASCWQKKGDPGPSIAEWFEMERCFWRQSDRSAKQRESGVLEMHRLLKVDPVTKKPKIFIFDTCKELIKCLASLPVDESNPEDVDTTANDHAWDALRYALMSRPSIASTWNDWLGKAKNELPVIIDPAFGY